MGVALLIGWNIRVPIFRMAIRKNFVDKPNKRSSHNSAVPNIGGIIVFLAFLCSFLLFVRFGEDAELQYIFLGATLIFLTGVYDDLLNISPRKKLKGEIAGVLVLIVGGGVYLTNLHGFLGVYTLTPWIAVPLTFIGLLGLVNAINLIDGIDGLSSGIALMDSLFFCIWFYNCHQVEYALLSGILIASLIPFFIINLFGIRSKMFMGDSGALMVGFFLGALAIKFCEANIGLQSKCAMGAALGVVFCVLAIPTLDALRLFTSRWMKGKSPFAPDKGHLHHKLLTIYSGKHKKATFTLLLFNLMFILLGVLGRDWPNWVLILSAVLLFAVLFYFTDRISKCVKENKPSKK